LDELLGLLAWKWLPLPRRCERRTLCNETAPEICTLVDRRVSYDKVTDAHHMKVFGATVVVPAASHIPAAGVMRHQ
jgi:hypothetical protein